MSERASICLFWRYDRGMRQTLSRVAMVFLGPSLRQLWAGSVFFGAVMACAKPASAHTSEGGFVLLLPTDVYISAGVLAVALTVILLAILPAKVALGVFQTTGGRRAVFHIAPLLTSAVSTGFVFWLIWMGFNGPRDPLTNVLPLTVWTLWWVAFVCLQGIFGDIWRWVDPWRGAEAGFRYVTGVAPCLRYPSRLGHAVAIGTFVLFVAFLLADIAPSDPSRLAQVVAVYWTLNFVGLILFGARWRLRADGIAMLMRCYARLGIVGRSKGRVRAGFFGWQVLQGRPMPVGGALFTLLILGSGSFDGVNETFWWLAQLGLNPLEFPGRSAVIWQTLSGLVVANILLVGMFWATLWMGIKLAGVRMNTLRAFCLFAPTVLPIALGYHFAHYFTSFLVQVQYVAAAASDPMANGRDLLGLGTYYVTTGFFNTHDSVRLLWLCQAGAVVGGHVVAILLAHAVSVRYLNDHWRAVLFQAPLATFMILYTFFGLWLLASPRGF